MENRRQHQRVDSTHEVWLVQGGPRVRNRETFGDLSVDGAFLRARGTYAVGRVLDLRFRLPSADTFVTCTARVRHQRLGHGIGVEFVGLSPETLGQIEGAVGGGSH